MMGEFDSDRRLLLQGFPFLFGIALGAGGSLGIGRLASGHNAPRQARSPARVEPLRNDFRPAMALSLKRLEAQAAKVAPKQLKTLGGLNRIHGLLFEAPDEVILLGDAVPELPLVDLDDLALALRSAYRVSEEYHEPPGCTIDPWEGVSDPWRIQHARVLGMPKDAAMGARFLAADYELKRAGAGVIALGSGRLDIVAIAREISPWCAGDVGKELVSSAVHRFWFCPRYPPPPRFLIDRDIVWISRPIGVRLLCEQQFFDRAGRKAGKKEADPAARRFAELVTELLDTAELPQYARMRNDFRVIEAAKLVRNAGVPQEALRVLLETYTMANVRTPVYAGGVWREDQGEGVCDNRITEEGTGSGTHVKSNAAVRKYRQRITGGVETRIDLPKEDFGGGEGALADLRKRVVESRPAGGAVFWRLAW
jgi:hypothetical protein